MEFLLGSMYDLAYRDTAYATHKLGADRAKKARDYGERAQGGQWGEATAATSLPEDSVGSFDNFWTCPDSVSTASSTELTWSVCSSPRPALTVVDIQRRCPQIPAHAARAGETVVAWRHEPHRMAHRRQGREHPQ
jgi:hypothetical protein